MLVMIEAPAVLPGPPFTCAVRLLGAADSSRKILDNYRVYTRFSNHQRINSSDIFIMAKSGSQQKTKSSRCWKSVKEPIGR